ncbi:SCO3374 family protein [Streptomyces apocyni]|uniref:SCO3374 family protein n=1 Tax=Streptomyces apocyni TaxID=2654677 RepID=UPI0012EAF97E|nr:SCO3374 family protein [Streptomyces apocyni]
MAHTPPASVPAPRGPFPVRDPVRQWYETQLGWATAPGPPVQLLTGLRFDVLQMPAEAGFAVLRRLGGAPPAGPVALARQGDVMRWLVAAGSADELPGLLAWLEWGSLALDLTAIGAGGQITAPAPPGGPVPVPGSRETARWVRPPEPGCEVEPTLPAFTGFGPRTDAGGGACGSARTDFVRLVETAATQCHRVRLSRGCAQALAFS